MYTLEFVAFALPNILAISTTFSLEIARNAVSSDTRYSLNIASSKEIITLKTRGWEKSDFQKIGVFFKRGSALWGID
jgi:hypothetical protein